MPELSDRPATSTDVATIRRIARRSWHAAHDDIVGADAVDAFLSAHYDRETVEASVRDADSVYRVVEADDEVVGFAVASPTERATWMLGAIYVHPDRWGEGAGTTLLDSVERAVRTAGGERLRLVVMADNGRARSFYESRGYEHVGENYDRSLGVEGAVYVRTL